MTDIVEPFQIQIGNRPASSVSAYNDLYNQYDYALGGVPFLSGVDPNNPLLRASAQFKREQIDQSTEPGEQSLTGWWLRSQSSFQNGAGLRYEDPATDETAPMRFNDSEGVNVWEEGQVTLLKRTALLHSSGTTGTQKVVSGESGGVDYYFRIDDDKVYRGNAAGTETLFLTASEPIQDVTNSGQFVYVSCSTRIYQVPMDGSATSVKWSWASGGLTRIGWNKERMMLGLENSIYELSMSSAVLPAALYTHPDANWRWTDFDEGPVAIYASGYNGSTSKVMKFGLDTSGVLPVLTGGVTVAEMPNNETVNVMYGYLGGFLTLGTTKGVRVATLGAEGDIQYGPLIETPKPVFALWARESHILAGYTESFSDGGSGIMRIELQNLLPNGQYAYATDLQTHTTGIVTSVCLFGISNRVLIALDDHGVYLEHATELESTGWLRTARIRYNMTWPKLFKQFSVDASMPGSMGVSAIDDQGSETTIASIDANTDLRNDFQINYPDTPQHFLSLRFTLNRNPSNATQGPTFRSYQLKALPSGPRPRQFTVPFLCFDREKTNDNMKTGYQGWCVERLENIEAQDSAGAVTLFEDLVNGRSWLVTIEAIEFKQISPPSRNLEEWGGILTVVLRTIA